MVHAADCHTAHRGPHVVLRHILERVLVAVGADGHVEHERVHVDDDVETPAVVRPGTPVGVIQRRARPRDHAVAGFGEGHGLVPHAALHDLADAGIDLMPDEVFAILRLVDAVECLRDAVDGIVIGVRCNVPFLPLEPLQLVLSFQIFDELIPVERHTGHFLNEFPRALDLLGAVLLDDRIVKLHRLRHGVERLIEEPVLQSGARNGSVARFVGRDEHRGVIGHVVLHKDTGFRLAHRARVARQTDGLHGVDVVENGVAVDVAGDKIRDHLERNVFEFIRPRIEHAAPYRFLVGDGMVIIIILLAVVQLRVGGEHTLELLNGHADHGAVVPRGGTQRLAAESLQAAVEPVQNRKIGLADPAVAPHALEEGQRLFALENVRHHLRVVVQPDVVEVVHRVLYAAPLTVLVKAGLVLQDITETTLAVRLAVPEILQGFFHFRLIHSLRPPSPGSS